MAGPEATAHERARGVVAAAFPARCDLSCRNCLSAGGPKYEVFLQGQHGVAEARCGGWSMIGQKLSDTTRIGPLFRIGKVGVQSCCFTTWRIRQGGAACALQTSPSAVVGYLLWDSVGSPSCGPGGGCPRQGVVAAAIPARFGLACKNHLSAGGPK